MKKNRFFFTMMVKGSRPIVKAERGMLSAPARYHVRGKF